MKRGLDKSFIAGIVKNMIDNMKRLCIMFILLAIIFGCTIPKKAITENLFKYYVDPKTSSIIHMAEKDTTYPIYINYNVSEINLESVKKLNGGSSYIMIGLASFCDSIRNFKSKNQEITNIAIEFKKAFPKHEIYDCTKTKSNCNPRSHGIHFSIQKLLIFDDFVLCIIEGSIIPMNLFSTDVIVFDKKGNIIRVFSSETMI